LQAISGIFRSPDEAERAFATLRSIGVSPTKISLLTPGDVRNQLQWISLPGAEQPGQSRAGDLDGADGGRSGDAMLVSAFLPGVGWVTGAGLLAKAILRAAGARIGSARGGSLEDAVPDALPEDEIFVYEDLLRKGRSVVIALAEDGTAAKPIRESFLEQKADAIDAARQEWWIGLRGAEGEHYSASGGNFSNDEKFYRMGFEAALHARTRCMEFDQVSAEMDGKLEDLQEQYPGVPLEEPFTRGYQRGREHFQALCDERAA
jgi:hypothetical protein